jgi:hypothetical protein
VAWSARGSKAICRATAEHALRPGGALRPRAGAGDASSTRGSSGGGSATWGEQKRPARGREGSGRAGKDAWNCMEQEVAPIGLQRRRAAARGGSGRRPGGVARRGEDSAARGRRWRWAGAARGSVKSSAEAAGAQHMAGKAAAARGQKNRGGGREVDEEGLKSNILKTQGLYCNVPVTFKPELK